MNTKNADFLYEGYHVEIISDLDTAYKFAEFDAQGGLASELPVLISFVDDSHNLVEITVDWQDLDIRFNFVPGEKNRVKSDLTSNARAIRFSIAGCSDAERMKFLRGVLALINLKLFVEDFPTKKVAKTMSWSTPAGRKAFLKIGRGNGSFEPHAHMMDTGRERDPQDNFGEFFYD